jgi:hypothetical protein
MRVHKHRQIVHRLQRSRTAWIVVRPLPPARIALDVRLWRSSPASLDPTDLHPTAAGFLLPVRELREFIALLEAAAREVTP